MNLIIEAWRRKWQPTAGPLPGKFHGWSSLVGYSPWGRKKSDTTEQLHFHFKWWDLIVICFPVCVQPKGTVFNQCLAVLTTYRKGCGSVFHICLISIFFIFHAIFMLQEGCCFARSHAHVWKQEKTEGEIAYASYTCSLLWGKAKLSQKSRQSFLCLICLTC